MKYLLNPVDSYDSTKLHLNHLQHQQHAMLLSHSDGQDAATRYVNEALGRGYLTVYLPITTTSSEH